MKESHRLTPCNVLRFNKTSVHRESCRKHSSELKLPRINCEPLNMYTYATQGSMILIRERTGVLDFFGTYLLLRYKAVGVLRNFGERCQNARFTANT